MPSPSPSIVGNWVTSFIAWFPVDAWQFLPDFAGTRFRRPQTASVPQPPPDDPITPWEAMWKEFLEDGSNFEEIKIAALKHPAPFAVLGSFLFKNDGTFDARLDVNQMEVFFTFPVSGTYHVDPEPLGGHGGEIILLNDDDTVHFRFKFLLVSKDEMSFITSYRTHEEATVPDDLLQSVAGTMRRVHPPN